MKHASWLFSFLAVFCCSAQGAQNQAERERAEQLGHRVMAVQLALADPASADAMNSILALGRDTQHYVMTRGWLAEQLKGDLSIQAASKQQTPELIRQRILLLENAIRAIDLE